MVLFKKIAGIAKWVMANMSAGLLAQYGRQGTFVVGPQSMPAAGEEGRLDAATFRSLIPRASK